MKSLGDEKQNRLSKDHKILSNKEEISLYTVRNWLGREIILHLLSMHRKVGHLNLNL
jgi:hypothetical protein